MILQNSEYRKKVQKATFEVIKRENRVLSNQEIYNYVAKELDLTGEDMALRHKSGAYVYQNSIQWGLLGLKVGGYINHESRGFWVITPEGINGQLDEDFYEFQRKFWNEKLSKKRKNLKMDKSLPFLNKSTQLNVKKGDSKYSLLSEILEQNKRILDILEADK